MFNPKPSLEDHNEFKPILAEIEDTPVSPLGRSVFWTVLAVATFAILWLCLGEIDVVVTARGKIIPEGQVKLLQPLETGVIRSILVKEGQRVRKGQVLMVIDPSVAEPELISSQRNLAYTSLEIDRLHSLLDDSNFAPSGADVHASDAAALATQRRLHQATRQKLESKLAIKQKALDQGAEELAIVELSIAQGEKQLAMAQDQYDRLQPVSDIVAKNDLKSAERDLLRAKTELDSARHKKEELLHGQMQIREEIGEINDEFQNFVLDEIAQREKTVNELRAKTEQGAFRTRQTQITAPEDGVVDQIFIHTVGGVVTPAEKLFTIVPDRAPLKIEAAVSNRDIGYVREGLPATVKVDTFDFQKYGTLPGKVSLVSSDSRMPEKPQAQPVEPFYQTLVSFDLPPGQRKPSLMVDGQRTEMMTGMAVTAEIKVGKRKIIEYFIYPLIKSFQESFSQR